MKKVMGNIGVGFAALLMVAVVFVGIQGVYDPTAASMMFGLPADEPAEMFYYRVYLARNLVIVIAGLVFLTLKQWRSVAILLTGALALSIFDAVLLYRERGAEAGLTFHIVTGVVIAVAASLMWLKASSKSADA